MTYVISKYTRTHTHTHIEEVIDPLYKPQKNKSLGDSASIWKGEVAQVGII